MLRAAGEAGGFQEENLGLLGAADCIQSLPRSLLGAPGRPRALRPLGPVLHLLPRPQHHPRSRRPLIRPYVRSPQSRRLRHLCLSLPPLRSHPHLGLWRRRRRRRRIGGRVGSGHCGASGARVGGRPGLSGASPRASPPPPGCPRPGPPRSRPSHPPRRERSG